MNICLNSTVLTWLWVALTWEMPWLCVRMSFLRSDLSNDNAAIS